MISNLDLVSNNRYVFDQVHGGQAFINTNIPFHSPTYVHIKMGNPFYTCIKRRIWLHAYNSDDFQLHRHKFTAVTWDEST